MELPRTASSGPRQTATPTPAQPCADCTTRDSLQNRLQILPAHSEPSRGHWGKTATLQVPLGGPWEAPGKPPRSAPWRPLGGPWGTPGRGLGRLFAALKTLYRTGCNATSTFQTRAEGPFKEDCHTSGTPGRPLGGPGRPLGDLLGGPLEAPGRSLGGAWQGPGTPLAITSKLQ